MSYTTTAPVPQKTAYKRPYKSRSQRRKDDREKFTESSDRKFLWRLVGVVGILLAVVLGFMVKGAIERSEVDAAATQSLP